MKRAMTARQWLAANRDAWWDMLRIYLGFALVIKGFDYMLHRQLLAQTMEAAGVPFGGSALAEIVSLLHIAGGLMLAFGIKTRLGALIQIPNVLGAVLYVHLQNGFFTPGQGLEFSLLVLFILVLYAVSGAGKLSIDHYFAERREHDDDLDVEAARAERELPTEPTPLPHAAEHVLQRP